MDVGNIAITNGISLASKKKPIKCTDAQIIDAIKKCAGLMTDVAKELGMNYMALLNRCRASEILMATREEVENYFLDIAESKLTMKLHQGDLQAIMFYLKCKGKKRGYIERQELSSPGDQPLQIQVVPANVTISSK